MNAQKMAGIVLIVLGIIALAYGGFSYTDESHRVDVGSLHLAVNQEHRLNVPVWAGIGALVVGGLLFGLRSKS
jgi:drug/metabolite transporter (DMT)-like permease